MKKVLLGNEAIVQGALEAGVNFVSTYPGCPAAEIGDEFGRISEKSGVYFEISTNEKVALESAIGASFSGMKTLVAMKNFGLNVCSDVLLPLCYTGVNASMVIVVGDDPNCWSSAQTEQNSRGYSLMAHLPTLEPSDAQECYEFTKLAFEISEKFKTPVMLRTTIRVAHQRGVVEFDEIASSLRQRHDGKFEKNFHQYVTLPPRVLEMKKELLEKIGKIEKYFEKLEIHPVKSREAGISQNAKLFNRVNFVAGNKKLKFGVVASGVGYSHFMEAERQLGLDLPVLKLGVFYPLPKENIKKFLKTLKKVLIVEELEGYVEREIKIICKEENLKVEVLGKKILPEIGELNIEKIGLALIKVLKLKNTKLFEIRNSKFDIPRRTSRLCEGCPHLFTFGAIKRAAPENTIFGGDIGCYMMAGLAPHNIQDYLFCMGSSIGIAHGIKKSTNQKVISLIGDGTFFHSGISGLINAVYNKSNPLMIILDNRITAMTGHQQNPGMGKNGMLQPSPELNIEEVVKALGVKNVKVVDPINQQELEGAIKEFLEKDEVSVIISKRVCKLLENRQKNG